MCSLQADLILFVGEILVDLDKLRIDVVVLAAPFEAHFVDGADSQLACNLAIKGGGFGIEAGRADAPGCWTLLVRAQKIRETIAVLGLAWSDKPIRSLRTG